MFSKRRSLADMPELLLTLTAAPRMARFLNVELLFSAVAAGLPARQRVCRAAPFLALFHALSAENNRFVWFAKNKNTDNY
jgi:hypothetical protein